MHPEPRSAKAASARCEPERTGQSAASICAGGAHLLAEVTSKTFTPNRHGAPWFPRSALRCGRHAGSGRVEAPTASARLAAINDGSVMAQRLWGEATAHWAAGQSLTGNRTEWTFVVNGTTTSSPSPLTDGRKAGDGMNATTGSIAGIIAADRRSRHRRTTTFSCQGSDRIFDFGCAVSVQPDRAEGDHRHHRRQLPLTCGLTRGANEKRRTRLGNSLLCLIGRSAGTSRIIVENRPRVTGDSWSHAQPAWTRTAAPAVSFALTRRSARKALAPTRPRKHLARFCHP